MVIYKSRKEILGGKKKEYWAVHRTDTEDLCNRSQLSRKLFVTVCMYVCWEEEMGDGAIGSPIMAWRKYPSGQFISFCSDFR